MQGGAPTIRAATRRDVDALVHINVASWREAWSALLPAGTQRPPDDELRARVREVIESSEVELAVAEVGGEVVGLATFGASRDDDATSAVGELRALMVDPAHWRRGLGRALVAHALDRLRASGRSEVTLWSLADSEQAAAFYAAQGFARNGHTQGRAAFGNAPEQRWRRGLDAAEAATGS